MVQSISASILAGGKSSRMKVNKALLPLKNELVIERIISTLKNVFNQVSIISNQPQIFSRFGTEVFQDIFPDQGPVSGIHSALKNSNTQINFIISCDMPLISSGIINYLIQKLNEKDILLPFDNTDNYPLAAFYSKSLEERAAALLSAKNNFGVKLYDLLSISGINKVDLSKYSGYNPKNLINMNTSEDYKKILSYLNVNS